jgi:hypothetical protein
MMMRRNARKDAEKLQQVKLPHPRELDSFILRAPLPVLVRSCLEWLTDAELLKQLFDATAEEQYTREITLDFMANLMLDVACGIEPSAGAALKTYRDEIDVSRQAFYGKLNRMEPNVSAAIVAHVAELAESVIVRLGPAQTELIAGHEARIVDGMYMGGRCAHRIAPLRKTNSAGLTGMALAVFAPATGLVHQAVLAEDAYTQERGVLDQLDIRAGQVWLGDRNFCIRSFLFRIHRAQSTFLIRWHASSCPYEEITPLHPARGSKQGAMAQSVRLRDPDSQEWLQARRIVLPLPQPTRNGDTQLILLTDLPDSVGADELCDRYRDRWQIETHFQRLTQQLHCEPPGLNHPRAALFSFAMSVAAANALAVVCNALAAQHGREAVRELSYYEFVLRVAQTWIGMAIAVPDAQWDFIRRFTPGQLAQWLNEIAQLVPMDRFKRSRRAPKRPQPKRASGKYNQHISNKRALDEERLNSAC